jgi:6-phosphofructokinase 1
MNASLAGVVDECRQWPAVKALYGARHGIDGALAEDFYDLAAQPPGRIDAIARTPGSALGSSRSPASSADYQRLLGILDRRGIRFVFFTGGNGSMYMAHQIALAGAGSGLRVIGIPKTIDNDIGGTDHTPGYGSTAWFFACAARDIGEDIRALRGRVTMVEVMGRNAGWLTAATVFARSGPDDPPHLIYLPERALPRARFLSDVEAMFRKHGTVVVAVCEGQTDENGRPMGDLGTPDGFDRQLSGNLAHTLARLVIDELGLNARSEKPGLLGRSSMAFISETDRQEAYLCGRAAVRAAVEGRTGMMISLQRAPGAEYRVTTGLVPLEQVGFAERLFPREWITPDGAGIEPAFFDYARPLLGPIQYHARLV